MLIPAKRSAMCVFQKIMSNIFREFGIIGDQDSLHEEDSPTQMWCKESVCLS